MMKILNVFSLIILLVGFNLNAQNFEWARTFGGTGDDNGNAISVDAIGNVYTTGAFYGSADFDPGTGESILTSVGMRDIFIQKLDALGNFQWAKSLGGLESDSPYAIEVDLSGNVYIAGIFQGTADFDTGDGTLNLTSSGGMDAFVLKLDTSGNFLWAKTFGGTGLDVIYSMAVDPSGNIFSTGHFSGTVDFDPGSGTTILTTPGEFTNNTFVHKMDADGNFQWVKSFFGGANWGTSINIDSAGSIYTTGMLTGESDFDPGTGTELLNSNFAHGTYVQKMDSSGNFLWARSFAGSYNLHHSSSVVDGSGNVYTTGSFDFPADFDPGPETETLTSGGNNDVFIQKMDSSGNFLWAKSFGGVCEFCADGGHAIVVDAVGNIYTGGFFSGVADFDPGNGTVNLTAVGNWDIFIQKLNANGEFIWARTFGGTERDTGLDLDIDHSGSIYTTGYFTGTVDFDSGSGTENHTSVGGWDIFVQKLSQPPLNLDEIDTFDLTLYPNPVQNILNISMNQPITSIAIIGMDGRLYHKQNLNSKIIQINLNNLPKGVYVVRIQSGKTIQQKKFVKK